jgi:elongation factor Ts
MSYLSEDKKVLNFAVYFFDNMDINDLINKIREERKTPESNFDGVVMAKTSTDKRKGVVLSLTCESDYSAKGSDLLNIASAISTLALESAAKAVQEVLVLVINGISVKDWLQEWSTFFGETINLEAFEILHGKSVYCYNHLPDYKVSALISLNMIFNNSIDTIGHDLAMQVAAMNPIAIEQSRITAEMLEKAKALAREKALKEAGFRIIDGVAIANRPPEIVLQKIEKNAARDLLKFGCLLTQSFIKDKTKTVQQVLASAESGLTVTGFKRVERGASGK